MHGLKSRIEKNQSDKRRQIDTMKRRLDSTFLSKSNCQIVFFLLVCTAFDLQRSNVYRIGSSLIPNLAEVLCSAVVSFSWTLVIWQKVPLRRNQKREGKGKDNLEVESSYFHLYIFIFTELPMAKSFPDKADLTFQPKLQWVRCGVELTGK